MSRSVDAMIDEMNRTSAIVCVYCGAMSSDHRAAERHFKARHEDEVRAGADLEVPEWLDFAEATA